MHPKSDNMSFLQVLNIHRMKNVSNVLIFIAIFFLSGFGNKKPAYLIYPSGRDKDIAWEKLVKATTDADVVFFGELHNNPICHWLELELTRAMFKNEGAKLSLGAEMFEADNQIILDEYLQGLIKEKQLTKEAKVWPNYDTDYAPLVNFAKDHQLVFIATNIPRRYANLVSREGLESLNKLSKQAKAWMAPLPIKVDLDLPGYKKISDMMAGMHSKDPDSGERIALAQATKDATMGWFIAQNLKPGDKMIHFNGTYHSNDHEGIVYYLKKYKPGVKVLTIATVEQDDITHLDDDHATLADFIIVIPSDMTKTY